MQTESPKVKPDWEEDIPLVEEDDSQIEVDAIGTVAPDDAYQVRTRHSFATHPISKGVIVLGISFMLMSLLGVFLKAMTGGFSSSGSSATTTPEPTPTTSAQNSITEADTLKAKLMLNEQNKDIKAFKTSQQEQPQESQEPQVKAASPQPVTRPATVQTPPVASTSRRVYEERPNYPPQTSRPSAVSRPVTPRPPVSSKNLRQKAQNDIDPMEQWLAAANVGSFSSSANSDDEVLNADGIEGGTGESTEVEGKTTAQAVDYNAKRVLVGSTTEGRLETPIFWGTNDDIGQNYLIKISKPLKASDGSEALPTGSYLVAQMINYNGSGLAQLRGVSVLINSNGDTQEKKLLENAVLIMSKNGSFLKAESRKGSNLGGDLMSAVIAGVAKAAEVQNRPRSQTNINSNGFYSSTTTNDDRNITAAFGEGAFNNVLERIKASNERRSGQLNSQEKVFVIDAGKTVQIFVNQTISL